MSKGPGVRGSPHAISISGSKQMNPTSGARSACCAYYVELTKGSMGRRGKPYDYAKAESSTKTLKVEAVYLMDYDTSKILPLTFPLYR